jgi:blue copper oxidase
MKVIFTFLLALFIGISSYAQNPLAIPSTLSGPIINLNLQEGTTNFYPGTPTQTYGANGNLLGPTLILDKDETVTINVTNSLMDSTTIHWHGMHVAPENDGGPHIVIPPSTTWSPVIPVLDWAATHWYHPHLHMHTNEHVQKGIAGMIIVRDTDEAALVLPRTYGVDDFPLVVQTKAFDANNQIIIASALDTALMVNGTLDPVADVPQQVVRFRLLNGSSERVYNFGLSNNQVFYQIASDGGLLTAPVSLTRLRLSPGERAEILIDFSGLMGQSIQLMSYGTELPSAIYGAAQPGMGAGQSIPNYTLNPLNGNNFQVLDFNVIATTALPITTIPTSLITHTPWLEADANLTRNLTFSPVNMGPTAIQGPFLIDMMPFDMMMINQTVPFNNIEIWTLTNNSPIAHPFHIHDVQFYVLDINGVAPPLNQQGRKDVILVPAGGGVVRFITKFEDFHNDTLPYMYHCHMLTHEDEGMMGQFLVQSPSAAISELDLLKSNNLYPNPVIDKLTINNLSSNQKIQLVDFSGKEVYTFYSENEEATLILSDLESGIYFVVYTSENGTEIKKIIKN